MNSSVLFGFPYGQLECLSCTLASLPGRSGCSSHAPAYRGLTRFAERALSHPYLVGLDGLEPSTSRLSGARSSHLSYRPVS